VTRSIAFIRKSLLGLLGVFYFSLAVGAQLNTPESLRAAIEDLIANPLLNERPILFIVRNVYHGIHGNTGSMFQVGEINQKQFRGGKILFSM